MSWKGFKRGWRELRQRELSWTVFKGSWNELIHPPRHEIAPAERKQREQRHQLGFPLFLLSDRSDLKQHPGSENEPTTRRKS